MQVFVLDNVQMTAKIVRPRPEGNQYPWQATEYLEVKAPVTYSLEREEWMILNRLAGNLSHYKKARVMQSFVLGQASFLRFIID